MDLSPVTTTTSALDDNSWLGSEHGVDSARSVTLDLSTFTEADDYPDGYLKPGIALGKVSASGEYGKFDSGVTDGRETCVGHLFGTTKVNAGAAKAGAALLWHGVVVAARLPAGAAPSSVPPHILYV
jgi:hypothetical protein